MKKTLILFAFLLCFAGKAHAQTQIQSGPTNPTFCTPGAYFYNTTSAAYQQCGPANTWTAAGGGITSVSSLPATCTPGTTAPVNLTINGTGYGVFICTATNTWFPSNPSQTISPLAYGAKWDAKYTMNATFSIGSATVTCGAGDCNFQCPGAVYPCSTAGVAGTDVGKIVFGYAGPNSANNGTGNYAALLAQTTITTVNSATSITAAATALANCVPAGNPLCALAWGSQDDATAINAAATAAFSTPGACKALQFPEGNAFIGGPVMNIAGASLSVPCGGWTGVSGNSPIDVNQTGPEVFGQGPANSVLIPTPNYNYAGCTNGFSAHACNGGIPNLAAHDFGINGLGQASISGNPTINLFELDGSPFGGGCTGSTGFNLTFSNWGILDPNAVGFDMGRSSCGDPVYFNDISELFGAINCTATNAGVVMQLAQIACFGSNGTSIVFNLLAGTNGQPSIINSNGSYYGQNFLTPIVLVNDATSTGMLNSNGDFLNCAFSTACTVMKTQCVAACTVNLTNDSLGMLSTSAGGAAIWLNSTVTQMHVRGTTVKAAGANNQFLITTAGSQFYDDGGNTFIQGGSANSIAAGTYFGSNSISGTTITAAKLVLSAGWGASAAWTALSGNTRLVQGTITNTGAGQAANPTITYTFPTPFVDVSSVVCSAIEVGGNQPLITDNQSILTPSSLTTTGVVFTYNGTPTVNDTEVIQISCDSK